MPDAMYSVPTLVSKEGKAMTSLNGNYSSSLYAMSIEELGLSEENVRLIHGAGITSIGDCIDFFARGAVTGVDSAVLKVMFGVVLPLLEKQGYWPRDDAQKA